MTPRRASWIGRAGVGCAIIGGPLIAAGRWWTVLAAVLLLLAWALALLLA